MGKNKKKKSSLIYSPEAVRETKRQLREFNWNRLLKILLATVAAFAVFEAVLALEASAMLGFSIITPVYYIIVTLLTVAVVFLNHGFAKGEITRDMLREDIPEDEAERLLAKLKAHRALAKKLMLVLIPFAFALLLDIIYLFYGDMLASLFSFLVPN